MTIIHQDNLDEKFTTWIIKYISPNFVYGIYLVWFTDNDAKSTDKLLTFANGKIFSSKNIENIEYEITDKKNEIENYERLIVWLNDEMSNEPIEDNFYDIQFLLNQIEQDNFSIDIIELFANYINLFGDYARQDKKNDFLLKFENQSSIQKLWHYYYEAIFWPRFYNKKEFENSKSAHLEINKSELHLQLSEIISEFDRQIQIPNF
ncbi:hypothetical protein [Chryseobacterium balustinum]|uniref:hypothetical protein n=1 Tax=Chryseobacterium balustinum TaxID=246 RepID=UPI003CF5FCD3